MPSFRIPYLTIGHLKISTTKVLESLKNPRVLISAIILGYLIFLALVWMSNLSLFWFLLTEGALEVKLKTITYSAKILSTNHDAFRATLIVTFSILQAINLVLFAQDYRNSKKEVAAGGVTTALVAVGVGCGACGTTLLTPVITSLGLGASVGVDVFGIVLMSLGVIVTAYSIHRIGLKLS